MPHSNACLNCGAGLAGPYCASCGQNRDAEHRSLRHLVAEAAEAFTHADSRLWRTLVRLAARPGTLTRDYLSGRRASQIPPLRLFLVAMLLLFGAGALGGTSFRMGPMTAEDHRHAAAAIDAIALPRHPALQSWLRHHLAAALDRPDGVFETMREWSERLTVLMLPAAALMLWALFAFTRRPDGARHTLFDHSVFAMHSLSAAAVVLAAQFALRPVTIGADALLLLLPVHLFRHLRGAYGSGVAGTLARMAALLAGSAVVAAVLVLVLAGLGLQLGTASG